MILRPRDVRDEMTQRFLHFSLVMGSGQQQFEVISFHVIFFPWTLPSIVAKMCLQYPHLPVEVTFQFSLVPEQDTHQLAMHISPAFPRGPATHPHVCRDVQTPGTSERCSPPHTVWLSHRKAALCLALQLPQVIFGKSEWEKFNYFEILAMFYVQVDLVLWRGRRRRRRRSPSLAGLQGSSFPANQDQPGLAFSSSMPA